MSSAFADSEGSFDARRAATCSVDRKEDHLWDEILRVHVEQTHGDAIVQVAENIFEDMPAEHREGACTKRP